MRGGGVECVGVKGEQRKASGKKGNRQILGFMVTLENIELANKKKTRLPMGCSGAWCWWPGVSIRPEWSTHLSFGTSVGSFSTLSFSSSSVFTSMSPDPVRGSLLLLDQCSEILNHCTKGTAHKSCSSGDAVTKSSRHHGSASANPCLAFFPVSVHKFEDKIFMCYHISMMKRSTVSAKTFVLKYNLTTIFTFTLWETTFLFH